MLGFKIIIYLSKGNIAVAFLGVLLTEN